MTADKYIAAIEISSSKIIGAIGRLSADGRLNIIAIEKDKIIEYVRYGIIQNIEETNKLPIEIKRENISTPYILYIIRIKDIMPFCYCYR